MCSSVSSRGGPRHTNCISYCRGTGVQPATTNWPRLQAALPLPARVTPELAATLQTKNTATEIPTTCSITWISYAGDEGGIMCRLDFEREIETATFAAITNLRFDARLPVA